MNDATGSRGPTSRSEDLPERGSAARSTPVRRPIPLPPDSLRPEPRIRRGGPRVAPPTAEVPTPDVPEPGFPPDQAGSPASGSKRSHRSRRGRIWIPIGSVLCLAGATWMVLQGGRTGVDSDREAGPSSAGSAPAVTARITSESRPPELAAAETPSPAGRLVVQAASCRTRRRAQEVLASLRAATALGGTVLPSDVNGERWYRVCLGPFGDAEEAARGADRVRTTGLVGEVMVKPAPPGWDAAVGAAPR